MRNKKGEFIQPQGQIKKVEVCNAIPEVNAELGLGHTEKLIYIERVRKHEDVVVLSERIWLPERLFKNLEEIPIAEFGNLLYPFYYQHCGQFISSARERLTFEKNIKDSHLNNKLEDPLVKVCRIAKTLKVWQSNTVSLMVWPIIFIMR